MRIYNRALAPTEVSALASGPASAVLAVKWLVADHLGTPRMIIDQTGTLINIKRHDYLPCGEELFAPSGGRSAALGYAGGDSVRQQFTQKERDIETGLDYFLARYYSSTQGRFTSPDEFKGGPHELWVLGSGDPEKQALVYAEVTNPQSLNKYQYAFNNPLRYVDPNGQNPQDSFELNFNRDVKDFLEGHISQQEFQSRQNARGVGAAVGTAIVVAYLYGPQVATAVLMWAARNPDKAQQITVTAVETAGGPPGLVTGAVGSASKAELSIAQKLAGEGKTVEVPAASGVGRTADFLVNGIKTELKTLEGVGGIATSGTVKSAIGRALGQSGNVIIDARGVKLTAAEAEKGAARAFGADSRLQSVRIIGDGFDFIKVRN